MTIRKTDEKFAKELTKEFHL